MIMQLETMEAWEVVSSLKGFEDYRFRKVPVARYDENSYNVAFQLCMENKCGKYNTNWGCNPAAKRDVPDFLSKQDYVILVSRTFQVDPKDKELIEEISDDLHRTFRRIIQELRSNNVDCDGFLDGPCGYCGVCAYPEPCRYPDMCIPSISTLGLNLKDWFTSFGEEFSFKEDEITLYGFVFVHTRA